MSIIVCTLSAQDPRVRTYTFSYNLVKEKNLPVIFMPRFAGGTAFLRLLDIQRIPRKMRDTLRVLVETDCFVSDVQQVLIKHPCALTIRIRNVSKHVRRKLWKKVENEMERQFETEIKRAQS